MRSLVEGGIKLMEIKETVNDPDKVRKLVDEWNSKMNENDIFDWVGDLSDNQITAIQGAISLEKEKRI